MRDSSPLNLAVFISGSGSNLQALIDACDDPAFPAQVQVVVSNNPDAYGLERASKAGIPGVVVNHKDYKTRAAFEDQIQQELAAYPVDLICLAGFMRIFTPSFTERWEGKMINTHPSLLPVHGGEGMYGEHVHNAVLAAGDEKSGVSIHYVIAACDQGPVILQKEVPVMADDSAETLAARVLAQEHVAYPEAVRLIAEGAVDFAR